VANDRPTTTVATGRVQQPKREAKPLPPGSAVDSAGNPTTDPSAVAALLPFGAHKGYGLALMNEIIGAFIGGSLPTLRNRWDRVPEGEKGTCAFFFQVWHPDAMSSGAFAKGRTQSENLKAVIADILGHGNEGCMRPGQIEADAAARSARNGGLLFSGAEVFAFNDIAKEARKARWKLEEFSVANP
jgi:L-2-hydroxycarboxylate dehydrogenase (NAD+)